MLKTACPRAPVGRSALVAHVLARLVVGGGLLSGCAFAPRIVSHATRLAITDATVVGGAPHAATVVLAVRSRPELALFDLADGKLQRVALDQPAATVEAMHSRPAGVALTYFASQSVDVVSRSEHGDWERVRAFTMPAEPPQFPRVVATVVVSGDFEGDGDVDLAAVSLEPMRLVVWRSDERGLEGRLSGLPLDPRPHAVPSVLASDLDGDSAAEFAIGMQSGGPDSAVADHVRVFRSTPDGFVDESWYEVPSPVRLAHGDLDGDKLADLVVFGQRGAWWLPGLGAAGFGAAQRLMRGDFRDGVVADVDRDGIDDVIALERNHARLRMRRGLGNRRFTPRQHIDLPPGPLRIATHEHELIIAHRNGTLTQVSDDAEPPHTSARSTAGLR